MGEARSAAMRPSDPAAEPPGPGFAGPGFAPRQKQEGPGGAEGCGFKARGMKKARTKPCPFMFCLSQASAKPSAIPSMIMPAMTAPMATYCIGRSFSLRNIAASAAETTQYAEIVGAAITAFPLIAKT